MVNKCSVCNEVVEKLYNGMCCRHNHQMKRYGKTFERTRFDPNEIKEM